MKDIIRVLIADDHLHEREGIKLLLSGVESIQIVGAASSAQETVQMALNLKPDVVVTDLTWYGDRTAGIAAIRHIKQQTPDIKIMAITVYPELIEHARVAGADLALDKDALFDKTTLAARIRDTYESQAFPKPSPPLAEELSERELEVLKLIAQGETDSDIATQLGIAGATVKKHVSNILSKLQVNNRTGAVTIAFERGILTRGTLEL